MQDKFPKKLSELPNFPFFAILTEISITIPGDERSRTNPGHGYPEHTENYFEIEIVDEKELAVRVEKMGNQRYKVVKVIPAEVKNKVFFEFPE